MAGLNKVLLIGNLGTDPELRRTRNDLAVLRFRLATTERILTKNGEPQDRTEWHSVIVWGKRAEALHKILTKGRTVFVEGRIQSRSYTDANDNKRTAVEIHASQIILLGEPRHGGEAQYSRPAAPPVEPAFAEDGEENGFPDDDIPF
ncbi:MAG: single-stranded DNA-binding protein [Deltaproteobacteria bacterium]|nr:single-stranded DNA-binding protein [Sandaracinaceae bacterium]MCX7808224.1 single-stranded DNA-binding protein [Deltaproteobacteria bacterium]MDW8247508.1 single-stranded DNA-binding protein [Sandaracinaceae bacterium]